VRTQQRQTNNDNCHACSRRHQSSIAGKRAALSESAAPRGPAGFARGAKDNNISNNNIANTSAAISAANVDANDDDDGHDCSRRNKRRGGKSGCCCWCWLCR
jgi:hypothetical protein